MAEATIAGSAVRLICRYSNGIVKGFVARAISLDGAMLRLWANDVFEPGIALTAIAPFISGMRVGRVTSVKHHPEQPGSYIVEVRLKPPTGRSGPVEVHGTTVELESKPGLGRYSSQLAMRLSGAPGQSFYLSAFGGAFGADRDSLVAATAAAVFMLLVEKKQVAAAEVLRRLTVTV